MTTPEAPAADAEALSPLSAGHHARTVRPPADRTVAGRLVRPCLLPAPGRNATGDDREAAVPAHGRDAFTRNAPDGAVDGRLAAWGADVLEGEAR